MKQILIIGGAGFIGSNLVSHLLEKQYCKIIVVDNLSTGNYEGLQKVVKKTEGIWKTDYRPPLEKSASTP